MGYTHYWTQSRDFTLEEWPQTREDFGLLLKDVEHVEGIPVATTERSFAGRHGRHSRLCAGVD
jgi:hypothetical protein